MAQEIVRDPVYRQNLLQRARDNALGPMEPVLWAYAYGKPADHVRVAMEASQNDLESLTEEQLAERAEMIAVVIRENARLGRLSARIAELKAPERLAVQSELAALPPSTTVQ
jgi:hypothetical protein